MILSSNTNCIIILLSDGHDRDAELDLGDEILADGIVFKDKKNSKGQLEVAIGDGMEFTIHGTLLRTA